MPPATSMMFPVGADFFSTKGKDLPDEEKRYLVHIARTSCKELIKHADMRDENVVWTPIGGTSSEVKSSLPPFLSSSRGGFMDSLILSARMFEGRSKRDWSKKFHGGNIMMGACVTQVAATLDEVASFYQRPTTRDARTFADTYQDDCLDAHVLYTLLPPASAAPWHSITVRWHAMKSPIALGKARDFCFLETHDEFVDARGRRGWILARESVSIAACPPLSSIVRASLQRSGLVFVESDLPGFLNVTQMAVVDFKGTLPRVVSRLATRKHLTEVLRLNRYLHEKRLSLEHILPDHDLVPKRDRSACHVCVKKFGVFSRHKVRCRKCGEVVCMQCQGLWTIDASSAPRHPRRASMSSAVSKKAVVHVRVCINCSQDTRERSMHVHSTFLNSQPRTNPHDHRQFSLDATMTMTSFLQTDDHEQDNEQDDISPMDVLQSARSRALHEYVRRTSSMTVAASTATTSSSGRRIPPAHDEYDNHLTLRHAKSVPGDSFDEAAGSYADGSSSPCSSSRDGYAGPPRGLSHSFVSDASSFRPSFTVFKKPTPLIPSTSTSHHHHQYQYQQPMVLPSSVLALTSPSYRDASHHNNPRGRHHYSVPPPPPSSSSATNSRRSSLPVFSNLAAQVDAALHYGHHTTHVPPSSPSSSRSSWRSHHASSSSLLRSPANRTHKPYTPRKSTQTFQFRDSKLVSMRTSAGTFTTDDLKSIERSLLADAKKLDTVSCARGSLGKPSSRGTKTSMMMGDGLNQRTSSRCGGGSNSSFMSSTTNHTPATATSTSSLSFSDDDSTLQLEGLREKVQLTLNGPAQSSSSTTTSLSSHNHDDDVVALYKQMKALRVAM
ncbi:hypothetical protein H257_13274 [Aphanomyces astaci]|uniref:FYVE-type domain-containing protein n=1 Tax=Aphanomyces astaci TaxID=112090 RepID=W4FXI4_APHAT|nr:hypothetical protein H257_13274 [Aphanomyces astaci]ETV71378.1 hypothetical protein H257_13274 [Aphanomyces astaci]|eukprot:XP_009839043.1 hypothetical protein H257_13274 [Aphanomyces astaci]